MKVKFLKNYLNGTVLFKAGEEKDINDDLAYNLISNKYAERVVDQVKPKKEVQEVKKEVKKPIKQIKKEINNA